MHDKHFGLTQFLLLICKIVVFFFFLNQENCYAWLNNLAASYYNIYIYLHMDWKRLRKLHETPLVIRFKTSFMVK